MARSLVNQATAGGGGGGGGSYLTVGAQIDSLTSVLTPPYNNYYSYWNSFAISPLNHERLLLGAIHGNNGYEYTHFLARAVHVDTNGAITVGTQSNLDNSGGRGGSQHGLGPGRPGELVYAGRHDWGNSGGWIVWGSALIDGTGGWVVAPNWSGLTSTTGSTYRAIVNGNFPAFPLGTDKYCYGGTDGSTAGVVTADAPNWSSAAGSQIGTYTTTTYAIPVRQDYTDSRTRGAFAMTNVSGSEWSAHFLNGASQYSLGTQTDYGFPGYSYEIITLKYTGSVASEDRYIMSQRGWYVSVDASGTIKKRGFSAALAPYFTNSGSAYGTIPVKKNIYIVPVKYYQEPAALCRVTCDVGGTEEVGLEQLGQFEYHLAGASWGHRYDYPNTMCVMGSELQYLLMLNGNDLATFDISSWNLASL